jgi:peptidoglycan hydrolase-like protein with peptidoglycan-binding domain
MMKRTSLCFLILTLGAVCPLRADETTRAVQTRLKTGGFYSGEVNGRYDSETAAAVTRYQIRNGLQITGKLDIPTQHALGVAAGEPEVPLRGFGEDAWRHLRKSDQEYLNRLAADDAKVLKPSKAPAAPTRAPASDVPTTPTSSTTGSPPNSNRERIRDYVAAFILAGLDPQVGSEAEFFADRVNYFGEQNVTREKIRRDLQRYDNRWPQRAFWLAGELEVIPINDKLKVSFPLRYEVHNGPKRSAGKVLKTLVLEKTGGDDLQIVAVNERKAR